jgi:hypothetical protein
MCGHLGVQENRNIKSSCREGHHQELIWNFGEESYIVHSIWLNDSNFWGFMKNKHDVIPVLGEVEKEEHEFEPGLAT